MALPQIETISIDTYDQWEATAKKQADVRFLAIVLADSEMDWTLDNALAFLAKGRANKPLAWTVTPEELPALWAELVRASD